jgi:hypothetical protein
MSSDYYYTLLSQLAGELGTQALKTAGGVGDATDPACSSMYLRAGRWVIYLEFYFSHETGGLVSAEMRAPFSNLDGFRFAAVRESFLSRIQKFLGARDVETGDPAFDREYIVIGTDEAKARELFSNEKIRKALDLRRLEVFQIREGEGAAGSGLLSTPDELYFSIKDEYDSKERVKSLFGLFSETLSQLERMGTAG